VSQTTTLDASHADTTDRPETSDVAMLAVVWSATEPRRAGEVLIPREDGEPAVFGRGGAEGGELRTELVRQRPGRDDKTTPLENPFLSRRQFAIHAEGDGLAVENLAKRPFLVDGEPVEDAVMRPGSTLEIEKQIVLVCVARPRNIGRVQCAVGPFGEPDAYGIIGESAVAWELRDRLALVGSLSPHVLLLGPSGSGKELAAQAIHAQSARGKKTLVARNAATFPAGLVDAELFGCAAGYPNAGMPERPGVIGEAYGSTLFLDEIAEMPAELQSHLLRVLDDAGEYTRLGEAKRRHADLRVIAATNRSVDALKHDLAARLALRITLPPLDVRREDIPLIARALIQRRARKDAPIGARYLAGWDGQTGEPRLAPALVRALVTHTYTTHTRELDSLLLRAIVGSHGATLELVPDIAADIKQAPRATRVPAQTYTSEQIRAALARAGGVRDRAWRELGMANRHVLKRLMKKYGIADD
jgi:two-component system nitrogen regulation response regulator GlnG/two-component system response regulator HydG